MCRMQENILAEDMRLEWWSVWCAVNRIYNRLFHAKDMIHIILSGICKMVDINRIHLDFVDADVLVNEQCSETVLAHQHIVFEYAQLRKLCKLLSSMKDFIRKLFA